jgi:hypothetical protein
VPVNVGHASLSPSLRVSLTGVGVSIISYIIILRKITRVLDFVNIFAGTRCCCPATLSDANQLKSARFCGSQCCLAL